MRLVPGGEGGRSLETTASPQGKRGVETVPKSTCGVVFQETGPLRVRPSRSTVGTAFAATQIVFRDLLAACCDINPCYARTDGGPANIGLSGGRCAIILVSERQALSSASFPCLCVMKILQASKKP